MDTVFQSLLGSIITQQVLTALGGALGLILVDFLLGILVSLKQGNFDLRKLPQFLQTSIIPYVGSLLLLALFAGISPALEALFLACAAFVVVKFLADIKDKLGAVFTGIQFQSPIAPVTDTIKPFPGFTVAPIIVTPVPDPQPAAPPAAPDAVPAAPTDTTAQDSATTTTPDTATEPPATPPAASPTITIPGDPQVLAQAIAGAITQLATPTVDNGNTVVAN